MTIPGIVAATRTSVTNGLRRQQRDQEAAERHWSLRHGGRAGNDLP